MGAARALSELASSFQGVDVLVLCYHQIRSRERFHSQMKALAEHGYSIPTMEQFTEWLRGSKLIHPPAALLTFDGCYDDQIENALPVLEQFQFPATFFPVSADLGEEPGHLAVLRRNELREIEKSGHTIGCHSHSHPDLTGLSGAELHREVHGSKQILEERMRSAIHTEPMTRVSERLSKRQVLTWRSRWISAASAEATISIS